MANGFAQSFEKAFIPGAKAGSDMASDAIKERIKKQEEKALKEAESLQAQKEYDELRTFISKQNPDLGSQLSELDISEFGTKGLQGINTVLKKQLIPKQKTDADKILEAAKLAEAGKQVGSRALFESATQQAQSLLGQEPDGKSAQTVDPSGQPLQSPTADSDPRGIANIIAPEIDPFTGKPTSKGLQQDARNKIIIEQAQNEFKGMTGDVAGRMTLADEAIKNITDIKKILFPDGTAKSFRRDVAFGGNVPGGQTPIIGSLIPDKVPFGKLGQEFHRKMGAALSARILIKTGVAARPEEVRSEFSQFAPSWSTNPEAALNGLNELESFYKNFRQSVRPKKGSAGTQTFNVDGKTYNVPAEKVAAFKKAKGIE